MGTVARWRAPTSSAIESPVFCPTMSSRAVSSAALASGQPTTNRVGGDEMLLDLDRIGSDQVPAQVDVKRGGVRLDGPGEHRPRRRLAPAGEAAVGRHLEEHAPDPGDVAAPVRMHGPHGDVHDVDAERFDPVFDLLPLHCSCRSVALRSRAVGGPAGAAVPRHQAGTATLP